MFNGLYVFFFSQRRILDGFLTFSTQDSPVQGQ